MSQLRANKTPNADFQIFSDIAKNLENMLILENLFISQLSQTSAMLFQGIPKINWLGIYIKIDNLLAIGPFQGKINYSRIQIGEGISGKAAKEAKTIKVDNINKYSGYISCDTNSFSKIAVPIFKSPECDRKLENIAGILDIESQFFARFSQLDQIYLENISELLSKYIIWK